VKESIRSGLAIELEGTGVEDEDRGEKGWRRERMKGLPEEDG
jgi:hypothetical protein